MERVELLESKRVGAVVHNFMLQRVPLTRWVEEATKDSLRADLLAGLTMGVLLIPQGLAFGLLAGLPPIYGLYASMIPVIVYAVFGTSRQLAVGPTALLSMLVADAINKVGIEDMQQKIEAAVIIALFSGIAQLVLGLAGFGFIVSLLSPAVLSGFCSASGVVIIVSQADGLLGVSAANGKAIHTAIGNLIDGIRDNWGISVLWNSLMGLTTIFTLLGVRRIRWLPVWFPSMLIILGVFTVLTWSASLDEEGVKVLGDVPSGFPSFELPKLDNDWDQYVVPTVVIVCLGYIESISIGKAFARKNGYQIHCGQELIALGASNLVGCFFGSFPVTGGFARTAVNAQVGAQTPLSGVVTAVLMMIAVLFLTPLFEFLPATCLSAIVITAALGLVNVTEPIKLWRFGMKLDVVSWVASFVGALFAGVDIGILIAICISWVLVIHQSARPPHSVLGRVPQAPQAFRSVDEDTAMDPQRLETFEGVLMWKFNAPLYFANAEYFKETAARLIKEHDPAFLVMDAAGISWIDSAALESFEALVDYLDQWGVALILVQLGGMLRQALDEYGILDKVENNNVFDTLSDGVEHCLRLQRKAPAGGLSMRRSARSVTIAVEGLAVEEPYMRLTRRSYGTFMV